MRSLATTVLRITVPVMYTRSQGATASVARGTVRAGGAGSRETPRGCEFEQHGSRHSKKGGVSSSPCTCTCHRGMQGTGASIATSTPPAGSRCTSFGPSGHRVGRPSDSGAGKHATRRAGNTPIGTPHAWPGVAFRRRTARRGLRPAHRSPGPQGFHPGSRWPGRRPSTRRSRPAARSAGWRHPPT